MKNLQKAGGIAALIESLTFIIGFALFFTVLTPLISDDTTAVDSVAFLMENQGIVYIAYLIIYVIFGVFLVPLSLALHQRLKDGSVTLMQNATAFGLIWAGLVIASGMVANVGTATVVSLFEQTPEQAGTIWVAVDTVRNGLGGGNEIVGGIWVLLISWSALQTGKLPKILNYLGLIFGAAGIITLIPPLADFGAIFGLGLIVWFAWVGIVLLQSKQDAE